MVTFQKGAGENIFVVRNGVLSTPQRPARFCRASRVIRCMTLAKDMGYEIREENIAREALYLADEVFMTGTAAEIVPVRSVRQNYGR
ncbi:aminotransferase class IV [Vibrio chagasii]|nr:aminotransferase class IV [Vibrio chagasii]